MRFRLFWVENEDVTLGWRLEIGLGKGRTSLLFLEVYGWDVFLWFGRVQYKSIPYFGLFLVDILIIPSLHFAKIDLSNMLLGFLHPQHQIIPLNIPFFLPNPLTINLLLLLFPKLIPFHMRINRLILHLIFTNLRSFLLQLKVLFKSVEFCFIGVVLREGHVFG